MFYNSKADRVAAYKPVNDSIEEVQQVAKDAIAWITIDDTSIDYPVMQGETNSEYLNKDPFGEYSLSGSIFLDSRNAPDFSDEYSLVYGHHMSGGYMFGALDAFEDSTYFNEHKTGTLITGDKVYKIEFFAFLNIDASEEEIFSPTETTLTSDYLQSVAKIFAYPANNHYIALSTCKRPETTERTVLVGCLLDS